jgi:hypothetical protein
MSVRRSKPDYPFLADEPGPELVEQELRNEFLVEEVHGNNSVNAIVRKRLGLSWMLEYLNSMNAIIEKSDTSRERSTPDAGEYVTVGEIFGYPVGTPPWHAENIKFWMAAVHAAFKPHEATLMEHDMNLILDAAVRLGAAIKEFELARKYSAPLKSGLKRRDSLKRTSAVANARRQAQASANHAQWRATAQKVWSENPRLGAMPCARFVISRLNIDAEPKTVADRIRDLKPTKGGEAG